MSKSFYQEIPSIHNFANILDDSIYRAVPKNWSIVITDVVNSTQAIEEGRYKDVNVAGGLAAMAMSNLYKDMDHPFVFGGDGVTFLIPSDQLKTVRSILIDTKKKVNQYFNLNLRVGIVPMSEILDAGENILLSKWMISEYYTQAILKGKGVELAENWVKTVDSKYTILDDEPVTIEASFEGFTCRWKDIPSKHGETISLILRQNDSVTSDSNLRESFQKLEKILGSVDDYHPITEQTLNTAFSIKIYMREAIVSAKSKYGLKKYLYILKIFIESLFVKFIIWSKLPAKAFFYTLKDIKKYNIQSSDFRKFDGSLKMVISTTTTKREELEAFLKEEESKGNLNYGIHISNRALLTCLMHSGSTSEVHFVDGADGGYALAAKMLKAKLKG